MHTPATSFAAVPMTAYFREQVLRKRTYLQITWRLHVLHNHYRREVQADGRVRFWVMFRNSQASRCGLLLWKTSEHFITHS